VTSERPQRPLLATIICVFEVAVFVIKLAGPLLLRHAFREQPGSDTALLSSIAWLSCILAPIAAVALWQMRRSAFVLLAARFALGLFWLAISRMTAAPPLHAGSRGMLLFFDILSLSISGSIAWYVYDLTSPETRRP
jgi:hypothetical protein